MYLKATASNRMNEGRVITAFLTGQSNPAVNALSEGQRSFLDRTLESGHERLMRNFPYTDLPTFEGQVPLWRASMNNSRQYLASRREAFASRYRPAVFSAFEGYQRVILLAGSCGLELLVNLRLPEEFLKRLHVFAYGPVSRRLPDCEKLWLVQGDKDPISRWWHSDPHHRIPCHHMNYLECREMEDLFRGFHRSSLFPADE